VIIEELSYDLEIFLLAFHLATPSFLTISIWPRLFLTKTINKKNNLKKKLIIFMLKIYHIETLNALIIRLT
jgi:hypothetical protein